MFCNKCGTQVKDGTAFCPNCGNQLNVVKEEPIVQQVESTQKVQAPIQKVAKKKKGGKVVLIISIVLIVIVAAVVALYFVIGQDMVRDQVVVEADALVDAENYNDAIKVYEAVLEEDYVHEGAIDGLSKAYVALIEQALEENDFDEVRDLAKEASDVTDEEVFEEYLGMLDTGMFYGENGRLVKQLNFDDSGDVISYMVPSYDDDGNEIEITYYDLDANKLYYIQNEYNEAGDLTKTYFFEEEGEYSNRSEEYDENGNVITIVTYDSFTGYALWGESYNANGDLVDEAYFDDIGELSRVTSYDEGGSLKSDTTYYNDGTFLATIFDEYGDVLQTEFYKEDGECLLSEYDDEGNVIVEYIINSDDTMRYYIIYEYYIDGVIRTSYNDEDEIMYLFDYDSAGRLLQHAKYGYDEVIMWSDEFDSEGNALKRYYYDDGVCYEYNEYAYNGDGTIMSRVRYDYNTGEILYYVMFDYDNAGNELGSTCYYLDGTLNWYTITELAYDGAVLIEYKYDENDFLDSFSEFEYDENGNQTKETKYNADGSIYRIYERSYNSEGYYITYKKTNEYGELEEDMHFEYDEDGYQIYKKNYVY